MQYQILEWDSDFFGIKIARILNPSLTAQELSIILSRLKHQRVRLVYWPSDQQHDYSVIMNLQGNHVDTKTTFYINFRDLKELDRSITSDIVESYSENMPVEEIEKLAIESGEYSRFAVDPNFSRANFTDLYKLWINKCLRKEMALEVLVIRDGNHIVGMVTIGEKRGRGNIGLIAVHRQYRSKHYSKKLVLAAHKWFVENGYNDGQVVTQMQNIPACNLYKKLGYTVEKLEYFYHFSL